METAAKKTKLHLVLFFVMSKRKNSVTATHAKTKLCLRKRHFLRTNAELNTIRGKLEEFGFVKQCILERHNKKWGFEMIINAKINY